VVCGSPHGFLGYSFAGLIFSTLCSLVSLVLLYIPHSYLLVFTQSDNLCLLITVFDLITLNLLYGKIYYHFTMYFLFVSCDFFPFLLLLSQRNMFLLLILILLSTFKLCFPLFCFSVSSEKHNPQPYLPSLLRANLVLLLRKHKK
jgi:hypothetical protein